MHKEEVTLHL